MTTTLSDYLLPETKLYKTPRKILGMNNPTQVDLRSGGASDSISNHLNSPTSLNSNNLDRLRMTNLMPQDFYPYWPYGQFMSSYGSPGVAIFPTFPYPLHMYQPNSIPPNYDNLQARLLQNSGNNSKSNEPNYTIQIGVQCLNNNSPVNINTVNDLTVPVQKSPADQPNGGVASIDSSYNAYATDRCNGIDTITANNFENKLNGKIPFEIGDGASATNMGGLSPEKFSELTRLAMRGCDLAERLAYTHRNRPCFKKIDSLCARMKQDLIRPDGVLPNINSQGIAWAVKDFIFVFTRIINAWIIIKGYVHNTPEGLNKVKSALSPEFTRSFTTWQDATLDFVENIIKSFLSLDQLVQNQKAAFQKVDNSMKVSSTPLRKNYNDFNNANGNVNYNMFDDSFDVSNDISNGSINSPHVVDNDTYNKSCFSTLVEDSEETQRKATANGTYFKTGTYNPLKKDATNAIDLNSNEKKCLVDSLFDSNAENYENVTLEDLGVVWQNPYQPIRPLMGINTTQTPPIINNETQSEQLQQQASIKCDTITSVRPETKPSDWLPYEFRILEKNLNKLSTEFDPTIRRPIGPDLTEKLEILLQRISDLNEGKYFFSARFTRNYFPDFTTKCPNFWDLRSIILKAQAGGYSHIYQIVHDLKLVIYHAKNYLKTNQNELLKNSIMEYEKEIDNILSGNLFKNWNFDHITGDPNESLLPTVK